MQVINISLFIFLLNYSRLIWTGLSNYQRCRWLRKFYGCLCRQLARRIPKVDIGYIPGYVQWHFTSTRYLWCEKSRPLIANLISLTCYIRHRKQDSSSTRRCICARSTSFHLWTSPLNIRHDGINYSGENPWTFRFVYFPRPVKIELSLITVT